MTNATAIIDRKPLIAALTALATAGGVIERRNTIPIVSAVLVDMTDEGARLTGSDLDIYASTVVPAACEGRASFAVSDPRAFLAAVKGCTSSTVTVEHSGDVLTVSGDGMAMRLETLPAGDFPAPTSIKVADAAAFTLPALQCSHDLRRTLHTVSTEETRYYLNGVFMHAPLNADGKPIALKFAATDGHRLSVVTRPVPEFTGRGLGDVIMPRKLVTLIIKAIGKAPAGDVAFTVDKTRADVVAGGWLFRSKLIDGTFPDYSRVVPTGNINRATFDAPTLADVTGKLAKAGKVEKADACKVTLSADGGSLQVGAAAAPIAATWNDNRKKDEGQGDAFVIGANVGYLAGIAALFGDGDITVELADACSPMRFVSAAAPEFTAVLMPLRVDGGTMAARVTKADRSARIETVRSAGDVFRDAYAAAFEANDGDAIKVALAAYRASEEFTRNAEAWGARAHDQLAMICAQIRCRSILAAEGGNGRHVKARAGLYRTIKRDRCAMDLSAKYRVVGLFKRIGERMAAAADVRARFDADLARIGYDAATDGRDVVPVILKREGKRAFVLASELANAATSAVYLVKANGTHSRRPSGVTRFEIERVVAPRTVKAAAAPETAPIADVTALEATVAAQAAMIATLIERMTGLETALAAMPAQVETLAAVGAETAQDETDGRDAYIRTLLAERDAAREDAQAAAARASDFERIATANAERADNLEDVATDLRRRNDTLFQETIALYERRHGTAKRLVNVRAAARTARREAIGMTTAHRIAAAEIARLQPIADAIAAMSAPAPIAGAPLRLVTAA